MKTIIYLAFAYFVAGSIADTVPDRCGNCHTVIGTVKGNFQNASRAHAYHNFLQVCGQMGNLDSACQKINTTFFEEIYKHLETSLNTTDFCFATGECSSNIVPIIQAVRNLPTGEHNPECELCRQLVDHVVSDLTKDDFHELLLNGCKLMDSFESDCKHITDEYYQLLHDFLVDKLNLKAVCSFVGICPGPGLFGALLPVPSANDVKQPAPTVQTAPIPVPKPVPIPVPVTPRPYTGGSSNYLPSGNSFGSYNSMPLFNFGQSPAYSLAPAIPALAALPALAAVPLLALG